MRKRTILIITQNKTLAQKVIRVAKQLNMGAHQQSSVLGSNTKTQPTVVIIDLQLTKPIDTVIKSKEQWPDAFFAGSMAVPDQECWLAALAAGCDLVTNQGSLPDVLAEKLLAQLDGAALIQPKIRLAAKRVHNPSDGLIGRVPDAPDGVIAIFRLGDQLCAFRDICPHAGFSLSDGNFDQENGILTCPKHGSQFNVCNGERVRGPADFPIQTYTVIEKNDALIVEI